MHSHPATGKRITTEDGKRVIGLSRPSGVGEETGDIDTAARIGPGFVVSGDGIIWGYDGTGFR